MDPSNAPAARDDGERLVFRQLYETLVEVDCGGRVRSGLATSWSVDEGGRRWRFRIRPDARFWDGSPVTARAVARSWLAPATPAGAGAGTPRIASVTVAGGLELTVDLIEPTTAPALFARTGMAVSAPAVDGTWPLGSGPYRPVGDDRDPRELRLVPVGAAGAPTLTFRLTRGGDARAALDAGADIVVSADPAVIAYTRALPDFTVVPLPWSRTYVLATADSGEATDAPAAVPPEALAGLARGAVRAEARPAQAPFWWTASGCEDPGSAPTAVDGGGGGRSRASVARRRGTTRIAYPSGDAVARGIAARLVALAGPGAATPAWLTTAVPGLAASGSVVSVGLDAVSLARGARSGDGLAYVVPLPRAPGGACTSELLAREDEAARAVLDPAVGVRVTPLLDVRSSLAVRRGVRRLWIDGEGTLRFAPGPEGGERPR